MRTLLSLLVLAPASARAQSISGWRPTQAQVYEIEKAIKLPADANGPPSHYERYYAGATRGEHRLIIGEYADFALSPEAGERLKRGRAESHVVRERELPAIADGGYGLIYFTYDPAIKRFEEVSCNPALHVPPPHKD